LYPTLGLIDYGMGNLHSVNQSMKRLGQQPRPVRNREDLIGVDALILPGVGAFDPAMANLTATGLVPHLQDWVSDDRPLLGICLGLQLLFEGSDEGSSAGLGVLPGHVRRLPADAGERIPHMGWAPLTVERECPLLRVEDEDAWVYFVHSFAAVPSEPSVLAATAGFGSAAVTAMVWSRRIGACQFHPEKSASAGERMLQRWLAWVRNGEMSSPSDH
tara:strand:- start:169 stop:819 length:651 start_codon:yes stop_codon:yes gene_type:complete